MNKSAVRAQRPLHLSYLTISSFRFCLLVQRRVGAPLGRTCHYSYLSSVRLRFLSFYDCLVNETNLNIIISLFTFRSPSLSFPLRYASLLHLWINTDKAPVLSRRNKTGESLDWKKLGKQTVGVPYLRRNQVEDPGRLHHPCLVEACLGYSSEGSPLSH